MAAVLLTRRRLRDDAIETLDDEAPALARPTLFRTVHLGINVKRKESKAALAKGPPSADLDDLDRRILGALQADNRVSFADLAERVGSSAASCMRRVNKLRAGGVIIADVSLIDPKAFGSLLTVIVTVELERERMDLVDNFKRAMRAAPEVTQCYMVTGDADFVLLVSVRDVDAFDVFVKTTLYINPNVRKFRSMISLDRVKFETRIQS